MLTWLMEFLTQYHSGFNVFQYITLRMILSTLTALFIAFVIGPWLIRKLTAQQIEQAIRTDGPESHLSKTGTPTMGGLLILISIMAGTLCWSELNNRFVIVVVLTTLLFGIVGLVDDYRKVMLKDPKGLPARYKYFWQSLIGLSVSVYL